MNKVLNKEKGITLIALVITIIVLLILAGVSISMLSGDNGILRQAAKSREDTEEAQQNEINTLSDIESLIDRYANGEKTIVSEVKPENYGDTVIGYTVNEGEYQVSDWKVFYNDGSNVWLMSSDYIMLDNETASSVNANYKDGYSLYWGGNYTNNLKDTTKWTAYVDENLAVKAMGAPTIEMFADSYNAKYPNGTNGKIDYRLTTIDGNEGYQVKWSNNANYDNDYINELETSDDLYAIASDKEPLYYILASEYVSNPTIYNLGVGNTGSLGLIYCQDDGWYYLGVRPIVCLRTDVKYIHNADANTWTIESK